MKQHLKLMERIKDFFLQNLNFVKLVKIIQGVNLIYQLKKIEMPLKKNLENHFIWIYL